MKFKPPAFLEGIESPVEGEVVLRKFANGELVVDEGDLFAGLSNRPVANGKCAPVIVVGVDEVGRGPLAGPVVACAAVLKSPDILPSLNDSKKLTRPKREAMYDEVKDACVCFAIASASAREIDEMNILEADFLAMRRALQALGFPGLQETAPEIPIEVKGSLLDAVGFLNSPNNHSSLVCSQPSAGVLHEVDNFHYGVKPQVTYISSILIAVDGNLKIRKVPEDSQIAIVKGDGRIASISAASILAKVFRDRYMDELEKKYPGYGFDKHAGYGTKAHLSAIRSLGYTPEHRISFHSKSL